MEHQFSSSHWQLAAICYDNLALWLPTLPAFSFDLVHNIHSRQHLAKHNMLPVQPYTHKIKAGGNQHQQIKKNLQSRLEENKVTVTKTCEYYLPACCHSGDEKLRSICIWPGIGHGQKA